MTETKHDRNVRTVIVIQLKVRKINQKNTFQKSIIRLLDYNHLDTLSFITSKTRPLFTKID